MRKQTINNTVAWAAGLAVSCLFASADAADDLARGFVTPPPSARPWVYWFPLSGNLSREGITTDLEAMARVGIGGVLYMEVDQGAPKGPADFAGPLWRELFHHACNEAQRLGLQINMNNDAGWCGSGGPWIASELSMQKVTWSETVVEGPTAFAGKLAQPQAVNGYYRDIAVLAMPLPAVEAAKGAPYRTDNIPAKASFVPGHLPPQPANYPPLAEGHAVPRTSIINVTAKMASDGKLTWDVAPGKWLVIRLGHTTTGKDNHPAPASGRGLECDKFSKTATKAMFDGLMGRLIAENKSVAGSDKTLASTHIDSWEAGSQNWTPLMLEEFKKRRGYDLLPFLPTFTGRAIDNVDVTERFLWDLRQTISDLVVENYAGEFRRLANAQGLRLSIEAYDRVPADEMTYAGQADEPMAEFWAWDRFHMAYSCTEMASAIHTYGKRILGAEVFTANDRERWQGHPANIKDLGDWAFCEGINRFVFHRYAAQPWTNAAPGMSMGPWGLHYERTQTWWEQSKAWHEYLARCQYLLQQGQFVADVCYLQPEGAPRRFAPPGDASVAPLVRGGYNFDGCTSEVVLTRMSVKDGRIVLPDGMSYRVLVLPDVETMTPKLLRKIKDLVDAGATVLGARPPRKSPSLADLPDGDAEVKQLADAMWDKIITGKTAAQVLAGRGIPADFTAEPVLRHIHRTIGDAEVYFVANPQPRDCEAMATFRVAGRQPELWAPDTGRIRPASAFQEKDGTTTVPLRLEPHGSVFVIFRKPAMASNQIVSLTKDGRELLRFARIEPKQPATIANTFTMAAWVNPKTDTALPVESNSGVGSYAIDRNDVVYPAPGHEVWTGADAGAGWAVGRNGVVVHEHGTDYFAAPLVYPAKLSGWTHVAVVYRDRIPCLYFNGKLVKTGLKGPLAVHPSIGAPHQRQVAPFRGEVTDLAQFGGAMTDAQIAQLVAKPRSPGMLPTAPVLDVAQGLLTQPGAYVVTTADGKHRDLMVAGLPAPVWVGGPWTVAFAPKWGGPASTTFEKLEDWSRRPEAGIKYYSGTATYRTRFQLDKAPAKGRRVFLDLGRVEVMAEVQLNGKPLGILWKPPYRVEVTSAVKPGNNTLEIKVVNLWINRMIGDEQLPEDSDRNGDGTLRAWPKWLDEGKPSPTGRFTFTSWRLWKKDSPLVPSGLLGPVTVQTAAELPRAR
ncbi:MAG: glycosyl hydrolase [Kiritimatiellaeota bacterium]|nr:glycosyl hydrolase [Kiritimatiellota bacterium]